MYTENDEKRMTARIRRYWIITIVLTAALIGVYATAMVIRSQPLAMVAGGLTFVTFLFMMLEYVYPCVRYRRFLRGLKNGLTREIAGEVVDISDREEEQDGVRVLPVRVLLTKEQDEHIVYLNADKRDMFPNVGATVRLNCQGRHILGLL